MAGMQRARSGVKTSEQRAPARSPASPALAERTPHPLRQLQRTHGNQAVLRGLSAPTPIIQTKRKLATRGDVFELEADRVARQALQTTAAAPPVIAPSRSPTPDPNLSPARTGMSSEQLSAGGEPLSGSLQSFFGARLGADLGGVRVHRGEAATRANVALGAEAFTFGNHVWGRHSNVTANLPLLAHELVHVVQQSPTRAHAAQPAIQRKESDDKPGIVQIVAFAGRSDGAMARLSDGSVIDVKLSLNELEPGSYVYENSTASEQDSSKPLNYKGRRTSGTAAEIQAGTNNHGFRWTKPHPLSWRDRVEVFIREGDPTAMHATLERVFAPKNGHAGVAQSRESVAEAEFLLQTAGVSETELLLLEARRDDAEGIGLPGSPVSVLDWAKQFVGEREKSATSAASNAATLGQAANRLSFAPLSLFLPERLGPSGILEVIEPKSLLSALGTENEFKRLHTGFRDYDDFVATLKTFDRALTADLRHLAGLALDDAEASLIRMDHEFVNPSYDKEWSPAYLWGEVQKVRQDPAVMTAEVDHYERTRVIDKKVEALDALMSASPGARANPAAIDYRDRQMKGFGEEREKEDAQYQEELRTATSKQSHLKLLPGSHVGEVLNAKTDREAQRRLKAFIVDGRESLGRARKSLHDPGFLFAADKIIGLEKSILTQSLGLSGGVASATISSLVSSGLTAQRAGVISGIIDQLASERRGETTLWEDIIGILSLAMQLVPGPIGWVGRALVAVANFDIKLGKARAQSDLFGGTLASEAPDPHATSSAVSGLFWEVASNEGPNVLASLGGKALAVSRASSRASSVVRAGEGIEKTALTDAQRLAQKGGQETTALHSTSSPIAPPATTSPVVGAGEGLEKTALTDADRAAQAADPEAARLHSTAEPVTPVEATAPATPTAVAEDVGATNAKPLEASPEARPAVEPAPVVTTAPPPVAEISPKAHLENRLNELNAQKAKLEQALLERSTEINTQIAETERALEDLKIAKNPPLGREAMEARRAELNRQLENLKRERRSHSPKLRDQMADNALEIKRARRELAKGQKGWQQVTLTGHDEKFRVGLYGELEMTAKLQEHGWEPLGKTIRPDDVRLPEEFEIALEKYKGTQGIDGIYVRKRNGKLEYLVADSKGTLAEQAPLAAGKGSLSKVGNASKSLPDVDQLSKKWIADRLPKSGLSEKQQKDILDAMAGDKLTVVYAQTRGSETVFLQVESTSNYEVQLGKVYLP